MNSLGRAYQVAIEMHRTFGEEAANVAAERADDCHLKGDEDGASHWVRVTAFLTHMDKYPSAH
jgi:hypothetical protein